ncbi:hypothetical protein KR49_00175 [Synechococcus sp. KORDI-49]|nr:hypothetical protein KR49_00175 [Synechococcus sp. KORDI-49]
MLMPMPLPIMSLMPLSSPSRVISFYLISHPILKLNHLILLLFELPMPAV